MNFKLNEIPLRELAEIGLSVEQLGKLGYIETLLNGGMTPYFKLQKEVDNQVWTIIARLYLWHNKNGRVSLKVDTMPLDDSFTVYFTHEERLRLAELRPINKTVIKGVQLVQYIVQLNSETGGFHVVPAKMISLPEQIHSWNISTNNLYRLYQGETVTQRRSVMQLTIRLDLNRPEGFYYYIDKVVSKKKRKNGGGN
jgi:hypothetical protein